jgi:hypothetical protein
MLGSKGNTVLGSPMIRNRPLHRPLPGFVTLSWSRMHGAPMPVLFLKAAGSLVVTLAMLRLLSLG